MKAKVSLLALLVFGLSFLSINASKADGEYGVYGIVNTLGVVTNAVVCADSNCGGAFGTTSGGDYARDVPVMEFSRAHGQQGGAFFSRPEAGVLVTYNGGIFYVDDNGRKSAFSTPRNQINQSSTQVFAKICGVGEITDSTCAQAMVITTGGPRAGVQETTFGSRLTINEAYTQIQSEELDILALKINTVVDMLDHWSWFK